MLQGFQAQMMQNLIQMADVIDPLATAAKSEPENIGHRVSSWLSFRAPIKNLEHKFITSFCNGNEWKIFSMGIAFLSLSFNSNP